MKAFRALVTHQRLNPKLHALKSRVHFFEIDLLGNERPKWPYSFKESDYLPLSSAELSQSLLERLRVLMRERYQYSPLLTEVRLITTVREWGYVFNPVSFYFIQDSEQRRFVLVDVHNTYGQGKIYWVDEIKEGHFYLKVTKHFYISPYQPLDSDLELKLAWPGETLSLTVISHKHNHIGIDETIIAKVSAHSLNIKSYFTHWLNYPLQSIRITALIYFHALLLKIKGLKFRAISDQVDLQRGQYLRESKRR